MTQLKFNFMDGLIIINDEEMLETAIQNLVKELDKEVAPVIQPIIEEVKPIKKKKNE